MKQSKGNLSAAKVCIFGAGHLGIDLVGGMVSTYLLIFYTDVFGISAAAAGLIMMLTKIWDAVNDPMMGAIVDSTHTKWGKFRPYLFAGSIFMAIFYPLTFLVLPFESMTAKIIWAAVTYTLSGMAFTMFDVPIWGMVPTVASTSNDRNRLITAMRSVTSFAYLIIGTITMPMVYFFGGGTAIENQQQGYFRTMLLMAAIVLITGCLVPIVFKEKVKVDETPIPFSTRIKSLFQNKQGLLILFTIFLAFMGIWTGTTASTYYVIESIGRVDIISLYMFVFLGAELVGILISGFFINLLGRKKATLAAAGIVIISSIVLYIFKGNIPILFVFSALWGLGMGIPEVTLSSLLTDTIDYLDWKKSIRTDGIVFSMQSLIIKVASAFAVGIIGIVLGMAGYDGFAESQPASAIACIDILRFIVPILFYALMIIALKFYKLDDKTMEKVHADLANRNS